MEYLELTYSKVAAAVVMLSYEPRNQVEAITGFRYNDIVDAINFVEPVIKVTRASVSPGLIIPQFPNVDSKDHHNIQTGYNDDYDKLLEEIEKGRAERKRLVEPKKRAKKLF